MVGPMLVPCAGVTLAVEIPIEIATSPLSALGGMVMLVPAIAELSLAATVTVPPLAPMVAVFTYLLPTGIVPLEHAARTRTSPVRAPPRIRRFALAM
jgi:hypothetical protein